MKIPEKIKNLFRIKSKKPKYKFPCNDCLILATGKCRQICDKVEKDNDKVKTLFEELLVCIDCGSKDMLEGPSGGLAQNVKCAKCGHEFNFGPPLFIHRIDRSE